MRRLVDFIAVTAGWLLVIYSVMVCVEIVGRRFFKYSIQGIDDIGGYLMAILSALGLSFALMQKAHVRIDLLLPHLPTRITMWLNVASLLSLFGLAAFFSARAWTVTAQSLSMGAVSSTALRLPLVYPQAIWLAAMLLFTVAAAIQTAKAVRLAMQGNAPAVAELAGSSTGVQQPQ
jgi:TRAP-type C4-dicarboxylate transport system permease small subunit